MFEDEVTEHEVMECLHFNDSNCKQTVLLLGVTDCKGITYVNYDTVVLLFPAPNILTSSRVVGLKLLNCILILRSYIGKVKYTPVR